MSAAFFYATRHYLYARYALDVYMPRYTLICDATLRY